MGGRKGRRGLDSGRAKEGAWLRKCKADHRWALQALVAWADSQKTALPVRCKCHANVYLCTGQQYYEVH